MTAATPPASPHPGLGTREMIALIAAIMAVNALGIDSMLPALPAIGEALGVAEENRRQWIIAIFAFGLGSTQLIYGPLADRYGRKPVMRWSLGLYVLASLWAAVASSFSMLLVARFIQGATSAATRVITTSVVRDCYAGRDMARVMSLAFMIFLGVPIFAPSIGQAILHVAPWPGIFVFLAVFAGAVLLWAQIRLPETLAPEKRRPIEPRQIAAAMRAAFCDRYSLGYTLAGTVLFGALLGFISSAQQLFSDTFDAHDRFPLIFALIAMGMGIAAWLNSRIVGRLGTRRVSHTAIIGFILIELCHLGVIVAGHETLVSFTLFQIATMLCFGLAASNFGAMAMERMGHIAGTAAAVQGSLSTIGGAAIGITIGQTFDGTAQPLITGFVIAGMASLALVYITERGVLFRPASPTH